MGEAKVGGCWVLIDSNFESLGCVAGSCDVTCSSEIVEIAELYGRSREMGFWRYLIGEIENCESAGQVGFLIDSICRVLVVSCGCAVGHGIWVVYIGR